ncbi:MAG: DUF3775 domain-containing protein [Rhodospirillaceae bacterium]|jgi:hypothetical protein|nr:DUF3775 domain-containing protein [Rhodospirillaceae bacterium]
MRDLSLSKVRFIIAKAREFAAKVEVVNPRGTPYEDDDDQSVLEDFADDATFEELHEAIEGLNDEEQLELVALMWVGRGDYEAEEWEDAVDEANGDRSSSTADYLIGTPLLADYLEAGLDSLGEAVEED